MQTGLDSFFKPKESAKKRKARDEEEEEDVEAQKAGKQEEEKEGGKDTKGKKAAKPAAKTAAKPAAKKGKKNDTKDDDEDTPATTTKSADAKEDAKDVKKDAADEDKPSDEAGPSSKVFKLVTSNKAVEGLVEHLTEDSWKQVMKDEFSKPYFSTLAKYLETERANNTNIYPPANLVFNALNSCTFDKVRVVILGQDPYFNPGQAMGLSFSVPMGVKPPPSLANIYKELETDIKGFKKPAHGDLTKWAKQGVLLLNTCLTVRGGKAFTHQKQGWETFTDVVIDVVNSKSKHGVVFMLWGKPAQMKEKKINHAKHCILTTAHPSPLSATKFFGCKHFSKANKWLEEKGMTPIDWTL